MANEHGFEAEVFLGCGDLVGEEQLPDAGWPSVLRAASSHDYWILIIIIKMDSREKQKEKYPLHEAILEIIRKLKSKKEYEVFHNILPKSYKIYHDTIEDPVSFSSIVPRLKKDPTILNFYESLHLIVSNCQKFNESGSEIVKISKELERDIERYMKKYDLLEELDRERAGKASHLAREYDAMDRDKARSKRQV